EETSELFGQDTDETFHRRQNCAVNHYRYLTLVVFAHIGGAQTRRQGEVQLYCTALPCTIEAVIQGRFNVRTVERAFTQLRFKRDVVFFQRNRQEIGRAHV